MSALHDDNTEAISKVQRVRQAASTLGISERTVYRRLRSGKLEQLPPGIPAADSVMTYVSVEGLVEPVRDQIEVLAGKIMCQNDMTNDKLSALRQELEVRDAQIRTLLENQQELTHTIQKLQAQIYELARLALLQSAHTEDPAKTLVKPSSVQHSVASVEGSRLKQWLRSLWRGNRDE